MDDLRVLFALIKRDLEQLDQLRCELKLIFREHNAAMSEIEAQYNRSSSSDSSHDNNH